MEYGSLSSGLLSEGSSFAMTELYHLTRALFSGLAFVFLALSEPVRAQNITAAVDPEVAAKIRDIERERKRFELWNECRPMFFFVLVDKEAENLETRVSSLMESRLRAARLYNSKLKHFNTTLYVSIEMMELNNKNGFVFTLSVEYKKFLSDPAVSDSHFVSTWERDTFGVSDLEGRDDFILQRLSEMIDEFVLEYLRVNETACGD